jgi:hypothetical protein
MPLIHTDGFDHYAPKTALAADITSYLQAAGYVVNNATNATFNIADGQDANSLGLKMSIAAASSTPPSFSRTVNTAASLVAFGFSFRGLTSRLRIARIAGVIDLDWDATTGKMKVGETLGQDVIILNAFWFIEIEIDKTNNVVRVWANDTLQLTVALPGGVGTAYTITWGMSSTSAVAGTIEIDDLYILDSSGGQNNARLGPVQIITRAPTADVTTQWTPVPAGAASHYSVLAQLEPGKVNAPYLQANVDGKVDKFTSNVVLPNANMIFGVALVSYARKGDLDNRSIGMTIETAGGNTEVQVPLDTAFAFKQTIFEQAPGGVPWTQNIVESSAFGIVAR